MAKKLDLKQALEEVNWFVDDVLESIKEAKNVAVKNIASEDVEELQSALIDIEGYLVDAIHKME